jgi:hypothetical protein
LTSLNRYHKDGTLPQNGEVFVFGANLAGIHGAGAAKVALEKFGAEMGKFGLVGKSWGIPTKGNFMNVLPLDNISVSVNIFVTVTNTKAFENTQWFVTRVGCGLAGYKDEDIAPMFKGAKNCSFAETWKPYLENENGV